MKSGDLIQGLGIYYYLGVHLRERKGEIIEGKTTAEPSVKLAEKLIKAGVI